MIKKEVRRYVMTSFYFMQSVFYKTYFLKYARMVNAIVTPAIIKDITSYSVI